MVIVMEPTATEEQIQQVIESLVEVGYDVHRSTGVSHTVLGAVGSPRTVVDPQALELIPGVREVIKISEPYKLVGRTFKAADTVVEPIEKPIAVNRAVAGAHWWNWAISSASRAPPARAFSSFKAAAALSTVTNGPTGTPRMADSGMS